MRRRYAVLLLAVLCLASIAGVQGYAVQSRASEQIRYYNATILQNNKGQLDIGFTIQCTDNMDALGATSIVVQRFNGASWVSEYTFNIRDYPGLQTQHKDHYSATVLYPLGNPGARYRATVYFYARNSTGLDTAIKTTNSVAT